MDDPLFDALDRLQETGTQVPDHGLLTTGISHREPDDEYEQTQDDYLQAQTSLDRDHHRGSYSQQADHLQYQDHYDLNSFDPEVPTQSGIKDWRQATLGAHLSPPYIRSGPSYNDNEHLELQQPMLSHQARLPYRSSDRTDDISSPGQISTSSPTYQVSQRHAYNDNMSIIKQPQQFAKSMPLPWAAQHQPFITSGFKPRQLAHQPTVQGIELVAVSDLPDRFRTLFSFQYFNAIQSKCFTGIYDTNHNFVLSSPTGSGKTVIFELAICRLVRDWESAAFKVVYMAPTKALCAERKRDWKTRFAPLGLQCEELTGDSDIASLHNVRSADIIVTTPEKWDSMTRKWKDHEKLVRLIKLFLIDEVHILNKDRGAALEAVVSRMKSVGSDIRFVALSATVPNSHDIAVWLGRDADNPTLPAIRERFGEEFRPVRLQKHVCGYQTNSNAFAFDSALTKKLPDVISKYSCGKPIIVFCFTRKSCLETAKFLADLWKSDQNKRWPRPQRTVRVNDKDLDNTFLAGVAFHHGGLSQDDRAAIEKAYLDGNIHVICCTSTLGVGVNLPCHMVIIKNTCVYEGKGIKEYSDLDIMQMVGRAGRPQFDDSAVAVIMTRISQVPHYEQMMSGQEQLESCLHLNLTEHLNAEIGLGTIIDILSAKTWLKGTFLRVRLQQNPRHYRIQGDTNGGSLDERVEKICSVAISLLTKHDLVTNYPSLVSTEYGEAMARYYVDLATMIAIMEIPARPKISEILSVLAQSHEFEEIRLRSGEKQHYKQLNSSPGIRFPIKVDIALPAHKVTLVVQSVLGGVEATINDSVHRTQFTIDQGLVFQHIHRLIRCIIDCQLYRDDAVGVRNALLLSRSFAARVWDDSPLVLRQIDQLGPVAVRKLVAANINSFEELGQTDSAQLERILGKNPAFAHKILGDVRFFPNLRVEIATRAQHVIKHGEHVALNLAVELGFLNDKVPTHFGKKPVFVVMLAETSDGHILHFCRVSAQKMANAAPISFTAKLKRPTQFINCYAMCDELAGTLKQVRLQPDIPVTAFQSIGTEPATNALAPPPSSRMQVNSQYHAVDTDYEDWDDGGIGDDEIFHATCQRSRFVDVDGPEMPDISSGTVQSKLAMQNSSNKMQCEQGSKQPIQLGNGKWACSHACKDKTACRHLCCREGLSKKPKPKKPKTEERSSQTTSIKQSWNTFSNSHMKSSKPGHALSSKKGNVEHIDLSHNSGKRQTHLFAASPALRDNLPQSTQVSNSMSNVGKPGLVDTLDHAPWAHLSQTEHVLFDEPDLDDSFDVSLMDDLPEPSTFIRHKETFVDPAIYIEEDKDDMFTDDDPELLDAVLIGAEDSNRLKSTNDSIEGNQSRFSKTSITDGLATPHTGATRIIPSSESKLFVSQTTDTPYHDDMDHGGPLLAQHDSKRRAEEDESIQIGAKRIKDDVVHGGGLSQLRAESWVDAEQNLGDLKLLDDEVTKESEMAKLRAWLAAELGDSVELVDHMDDAF